MVRKVTLTKDLLSKVKEIYVHDAEIKEIICNYVEHKIIIHISLPLPQQNTALLIFKGVTYSEISYHEPWGTGFYIIGIGVEDELSKYETFFDINGVDDYKSVVKDNHCFKTTIELNSGDRINIVANKMIYHEDMSTID